MEQPIPGIDFCPVAAEYAAVWDIPDEHWRVCPVCIRKFRMRQSELQNWMPMTYEHACGIMQEMAEEFIDGQYHGHELRYRQFYRHLAMNETLEREFAVAVAVAIGFNNLPPFDDSQDDDGGSGVREPRRPYPSAGPTAAIAISEQEVKELLLIER